MPGLGASVTASVTQGGCQFLEVGGPCPSPFQASVFSSVTWKDHRVQPSSVGESDTRTEVGVFYRLFCGCLAGQVSDPAHSSGVILSPTLSEKLVVVSASLGLPPLRALMRGSGAQALQQMALGWSRLP